jgi:rhodanese-related sulfurtransferase
MRRKRHFGQRFMIVFVGLSIFGGCADRISRPDLLARIKSNSQPRIVDVRSTAEFEEARVPGSIHVSFYSLLFNLDSLPESEVEDEPYVLYCEHGPRAGLARAQLWLAGVGPVLFMEGHMIGWKEDGLPVETGKASSSRHTSQISETRSH